MLDNEMEPGRLTVKYDNNNPVELADLTLSLMALGDEYKRFTVREYGPAAAENIKLYVSEMRKGSIIADLVVAGGVALLPLMPYMSNINTVVGFGKHIGSAVDWLRNQSNPPEKVDKVDLENIKQFLEVTAKDKDGKVSLTTRINGDNNQIHLHIGSNDARAVQNQADREIKALGVSASGTHHNVLLYWTHSKRDVNSRTGEKAIIEKFSPGPVKTVVPSQEIKAQMIHSEKNPFRVGYVVDVDVQTIRDKPALYTVLALHDVIDLDEPPHPELPFPQ